MAPGSATSTATRAHNTRQVFLIVSSVASAVKLNSKIEPGFQAPERETGG
jgi:hypothetical protein